MIEIILAGFVVGVLVYDVIAALLDPQGDRLLSVGF
jgi:hypothetical protein